MTTSAALKLAPTSESNSISMFYGDASTMMTSVASSMMTSVATSMMTSVATASSTSVAMDLSDKFSGGNTALMTSVAEI